MISRPSILDSHPWQFPTPDIAQLDSGMRLWSYHLPGQLILAADLVMELPINSEPVGCEGVATIAVRTLDEGTHAHPGPEFAAAMEDAAARFHGLIGMSTTQCLLDLPYDCLDAGLELLAEAVSQPGYADEDVARIIAHRLAEIEQQESRGSYQASTALRRTLLDPALRVSRPIGGTAEDLRSLSAKDVAAFHRTHYRPQDATLIIAGDLSGIDTLTAAQQAFDSWNPSAQPVLPDPITPGDRRRRVIHRDGAVQADIRLGWFGIDRRDPRWAPLQVGLAIMGGTFNSRLNTVLREERGYTYGVSMAAHPYRQGGTIDVSTSTRTAMTSALLDETLEILQAREPFTNDEVDAAIGYLTLSAPLAFDTAEAVAAQAASIAAARLELDHVTTTLDNLRKVTPAAAMEAYTSLVTPDQGAIVVVGDSNDMSDLGFTDY